MHTVETDWWLLDLPEEWSAEQDEETIVIADEDGIGEIEITRLENAAGAAANLHELAAQWLPEGVHGSDARIGEFTGLYFAYRDEGDAVREWLLRAGDLILIVSYACDEDDTGMDDETVDEILATLSINAEKNNAS
jgi:hypothetical protein